MPDPTPLERIVRDVVREMWMNVHSVNDSQTVARRAVIEAVRRCVEIADGAWNHENTRECAEAAIIGIKNAILAEFPEAEERR